MITIEGFLEAEGALTPQEFVNQHADALGLKRPIEVKVKTGASVWRFLDECLYALMTTNGTGYVEGAMSRETGVCCQTFAKGLMQCFACPFRSAQMSTLQRFYQETKEKVLAMDKCG
jgi:hypothetical protein